jgi:hypothetical protein
MYLCIYIYVGGEIKIQENFKFFLQKYLKLFNRKN